MTCDVRAMDENAAFDVLPLSFGRFSEEAMCRVATFQWMKMSYTEGAVSAQRSGGGTGTASSRKEADRGASSPPDCCHVARREHAEESCCCSVPSVHRRTPHIHPKKERRDANHV